MYNNDVLNLHGFNISVFKRNVLLYLYIYNNLYYCFIKIPQTTKIKLKTKLILEISNKNLIKIDQLKVFLKQFLLCESTKIRFTGKGYKIKKNTKNSLMLLFNRSHITTLWWKNILVKRLKKYKLFLKYGLVNKGVVETILNIRYINIFTKKGLRKARQVLFKKKGKK